MLLLRVQVRLTFDPWEAEMEGSWVSTAWVRELQTEIFVLWHMDQGHVSHESEPEERKKKKIGFKASQHHWGLMLPVEWERSRRRKRVQAMERDPRAPPWGWVTLCLLFFPTLCQKRGYSCKYVSFMISPASSWVMVIELNLYYVDWEDEVLFYFFMDFWEKHLLRWDKSPCIRT